MHKRYITMAALVGSLALTWSAGWAQQTYDPEAAARTRGIVSTLLAEDANSVSLRQSQAGSNGRLSMRTGNVAKPDGPLDQLRTSDTNFVQPAVHSSNLADSNWLNRRANLDPQTVAPSFMEREPTSDPVRDSKNIRDWIVRISVNLVFVLFVMAGVVLFLRNRQRGVGTLRTRSRMASSEIRVSQVIPLSRGASLHVVQGLGQQVVVAIDSSGIKSLQVLAPSFRDSLEDDPRIHPKDENDDPMDPDEELMSDREIDEKLISMLLRGSKKAA